MSIKEQLKCLKNKGRPNFVADFVYIANKQLFLSLGVYIKI